MLEAAERPLIVAGGGVINADASDLLVAFAEIVNVPVVPTLMGWGAIPDDHVLMAGMGGVWPTPHASAATTPPSLFFFVSHAPATIPIPRHTQNHYNNR